MRVLQDHRPTARIPLSVALFALCACSKETSEPLSPLSATDLRCEGTTAPLAIPTVTPRLTWKVQSQELSQRGHDWSAYQLQVARRKSTWGEAEPELWDSGWVESEGAVSTVYGGVPLVSRDSATWRVRVRDTQGDLSPWSPPAHFSVGLLSASDWSGSWIAAPEVEVAAVAEQQDSTEGLPDVEAVPEGSADQEDQGSAVEPEAPEPERFACPLFRREFELNSPPERALLHVASVGYHEVLVNGHRVEEALLAPSVSDLSQRVQACTYDVTSLLGSGDNVVGLWLGPGWSRYPRYGLDSDPFLRANLEVQSADGDELRLATGPEWRVHSSQVESIGGWNFGDYGGERITTSQALNDWSNPGFDSSEWPTARVVDASLDIVPERVEPNRVVTQWKAVTIEELEPGVYRADFGKTFTGQVEARLSGEPGSTITLSFSEREDQNVTYSQRSEVVLDDDGLGTFKHHFNHVTARWVTFEGLITAPVDVRALQVRSGYDRSGSFRCSDPLLQRIYDTVAWTFECLSLGGYVVDCAHRERWGYGGDAHATMETALALFDLDAFYTDWLDDWAAIQADTGNLPFTCPTYHGGGGPAWSGIVVMLPWEIYQRTGKRELLESMWPTMERWLDFLETQTEEGLLQFYFDESYTADVYSFLGDWVPPGGAQFGALPDERRRFFNNAYRVWAVRTAAKIARELDLEEDAAELEQRADELAQAVHEQFYDPETGLYVEARQTYYTLPILSQVAPPDVERDLFERLIQDLEERQHIDTGIHGTWFLVKLLLERNRVDLLHRVATQRDYPSWGHMFEQGATTIWEQWDGVHSRTHSSFLSIGAFFTEGLLGIRSDPTAPGYRHFSLQPAVGTGGLTEASGQLDTVRGTISVEWTHEGGQAELHCTIPPGTHASLHLPTTRPQGVLESGVLPSQASGLSAIEFTEDRFACQLTAGHYTFQFEL